MAGEGGRAGPRPSADDEYAPLEVPDAWHVVALVCFVAALASKLLVGLLPAELRSYPASVLLPPLASALASTCGLLFALMGLRQARGRALARAALMLNSVVLLLCALAIAAFYWILRR
ncbi:MAG: hypothetical protein U0X73_18930 [Thermoanaerobaculia bacterium]